MYRLALAYVLAIFVCGMVLPHSVCVIFSGLPSLNAPVRFVRLVCVLHLFGNPERLRQWTVRCSLFAGQCILGCCISVSHFYSVCPMYFPSSCFLSHLVSSLTFLCSSSYSVLSAAVCCVCSMFCRNGSRISVMTCYTLIVRPVLCEIS